MGQGNNKKKEKKPPEKIDHWNVSLLREIAAEVDLHISHRFDTEENLSAIPTIDYDAPGFTEPGVAAIFGGDHGDKAFPFSVKLNLTSPQQRKESKKLNDQCPTVPIASIDCSKDTHTTLENTIMPQIRNEIAQLKRSLVLVVYDKDNVKECFHSYIVPKTINITSVSVLPNDDAVILQFLFSTRML